MNIMKFRYWFLGFSMIFLIPSILFLTFFGFEKAIDFTGGSVLEISFEEPVKEVSSESLASNLADNYAVESIQSSGKDNFLIKMSQIDNQQKDELMAQVSQEYGPLTELRFSTVGPTLGKENINKMLIAVVIVAVIITVYVWKQFKELRYGVCAVTAMIHDSLILLGSFSILGYFWGVEVDLLFVTAVLTTLSFSVHDTIVVFDRIRELKRKHGGLDYQTLINTAVIETVSRSINNSLTIILMLLTLVLIGGETIRYFAVALLIGAITGTYSSTFVAAPLLLVWDDLKQRMKQE